MADYTHTKLELVAILEPETHRTVTPDGRVTEDELPGLLHIGTEIDGVFVPLITVKAGVLNSSAAQAARAAKSDKKTAPDKG